QTCALLIVGSVNLAVVVTTTAQRPNLVIGHVFNQLQGALIAAEDLLAHISAVVGLESLVVTIRSCVHDVDKCAILVCFEQLVPCATPNDLGDVPASAAEEGLQLLDNLGVTTHRAVKTL